MQYFAHVYADATKGFSLLDSLRITLEDRPFWPKPCCDVSLFINIGLPSKRAP